MGGGARQGASRVAERVDAHALHAREGKTGAGLPGGEGGAGEPRSFRRRGGEARTVSRAAGPDDRQRLGPGSGVQIGEERGGRVRGELKVNRRTVLTLPLASLGAAVSAAFGQPSGKPWRIGFLSPAAATSSVWAARVESLRAGLRELGYIEGKNIAIDFRWADGDLERLPALVAELVRLKPDVLVTATTPGAIAAKRATQSIPIVLASVGDPVITGVVSSLARPGGNVTGSSLFTADESAKRLELIRDTLPRARRVALLVNPTNPLWKA